MPKAKNENWVGYWEPTKPNKAHPSRASRATNVYDRDRAFRQSQKDAFLIAPQEGDRHKNIQQRGEKRRADIDDSESEHPHTKKAARTALDQGDVTEAEGNTTEQGSGDETEINENTAVLTVPTKEQLLSETCQRLARMEAKMQSLEKTTNKHVDDFDYIVPWVAELSGIDQTTNERIERLEKELDDANSRLGQMQDLFAKILQIVEKQGDRWNEMMTLVTDDMAGIRTQAKDKGAEENRQVGPACSSRRQQKGAYSDGSRRLIWMWWRTDTRAINSH
ncbi:hypothetical protein ACHAPT_003275 [Fusarium lateritium]